MHTYAEALYLRRIHGDDVVLAPDLAKLSLAELEARAAEERRPVEEERQRERLARIPQMLGRLLAAPPKRRTPARMRTYFLRQFALSGSQVEAAARTGVSPRTVQRWRQSNPAFAARYAAVMAERLELLEDRAMRRAQGVDQVQRFYAGKQIASVERYNDGMLMRVLGRFDRTAELEQKRRDIEAEIERRVAIVKREEERFYEEKLAFVQSQINFRAEVLADKRIHEMSLKTRHDTEPPGVR